MAHNVQVSERAKSVCDPSRGKKDARVSMGGNVYVLCVRASTTCRARKRVSHVWR